MNIDFTLTHSENLSHLVPLFTAHSSHFVTPKKFLVSSSHWVTLNMVPPTYPQARKLHRFSSRHLIVLKKWHSFPISHSTYQLRLPCLWSGSIYGLWLNVWGSAYSPTFLVVHVRDSLQLHCLPHPQSVVFCHQPSANKTCWGWSFDIFRLLSIQPQRESSF